MTCPSCGAVIDGVDARGPGVHEFDPCGCPVPTASAHDLASGADRGRGVRADGGWEPWCDWCQLEFGPEGPDWKVDTGVVTGWFCSEDCADSWRDSADTPERVGEQQVATDGGTSVSGTEQKDVLIRADAEEISEKIRENIDDPWSTKCYWTVSGTPQETGRGQQVFFHDGDEFWGLANITGVDEGAIWFKPIRRLVGLTVDIDAEPPTRRFQYVDADEPSSTGTEQEDPS